MELSTQKIAESRQAFWDRIKSDFTASEFEDLQNALGYSKYKWTAVQNGTRDFRVEDIDTISEITGIDKLALLKDYCLLTGNITVQSYCKMVEDVAA
ncbi:MAG: hypothetical protein AAFY91_14765 [Bacteroidota bacterium]